MAKATKQNRGLPEDFDLMVDSSSPVLSDEAPVQLGDYLDSNPAIIPQKAQPVKKVKNKAKPAKKIVEEVVVQNVSASQEAPKAKRAQAVKPPRREVNMKPETVKMFDELLGQIRDFSPQPDTKGSELFHALVYLLYQAKSELDLRDVPKRGQWGSPTASAFKTSLAQAFEKAIVSNNKKRMG